MARSHSAEGGRGVSVALACALVGVAACVDDAGRAWGELAVVLDVGLAPGPDRVDELGRWRTAHGFAVAGARVDLALAEVAFGLASEAALPFDPAAPPEGYSLCHGGHCHADDGSLPTYAEIAAKLAGEGAATALSSEIVGTVSVGLPMEVSRAALQRCTPAAPCGLERGALGSATVLVASVRLRGQVYGASPALAASLGPAGRPLDVTLPVALQIGGPLAVDIDRGAAFRQQLALRLDLGPGLLDTLPLERFSLEGTSMADSEADLATLRAALVHAGNFSSTTTAIEQ